MRILHVTDRLTERGGAYTWLLGVITLLAHDHDQRLVAGVDMGNARPPCPIQLCPGLDQRTEAKLDLAPIVETFAPDVVHIHNVMTPTALDWASARTDTVLTVQDHRYFCPMRGKWTLSGEVCRRRMDRSTCEPCFRDTVYFQDVYTLTERRLAAVRRLEVTVLSGYMREELLAVGLSRNRVHIVPPFVYALDLDAEPDGPPCLLFVGRFAEAKGVMEAVQAWRLSDVDLPLVLAGSGPLRAELTEEARRPGRSQLEVLGWVDRARLSRLYRRARALILPSRWQEPFGIVGLEALAFGVPVVAWDSGGVREWHPGPGLVPWGDVRALAEALREAIRRRAEPLTGFDPVASVRRLVEVYAGVAGRKAAAR